MPSHLERVRACHAAALVGELVAAGSFKAATPEAIAAAVNGCGAAGAKFDFVPDKILGLRISPACYIHDWDYTDGASVAHKQVVDLRFLTNILTLIQRERGVVAFILRPFRRRQALVYYEAVADFGASAYWVGKPK